MANLRMLNGPKVRIVIAALATALLFQWQQVCAENVVIPAYFYPGSTGGYWNQINTAAASVPTIAIFNPNSGPGTAVDQNYLQAINKLHAAGGKAYGYVHTSYGTRLITDVTKDINTYLAFYPVDGIFIDEMTNDSSSASLNYYFSIYNYVKGLNTTYGIIGNPGTSVPESYASLPVADRLVVFESSAKVFSTYKPAAWQASYPADRFIGIIHSATQKQMQTICQFSATHGIKNIYITSDSGSNPYDTLPPYWNDEILQAATH